MKKGSTEWYKYHASELNKFILWSKTARGAVVNVKWFERVVWGFTAKELQDACARAAESIREFQMEMFKNFNKTEK